jgi:site-specific recombinase XerD
MGKMDKKPELTVNQKRNTEIFYEYSLWRAENGATAQATVTADRISITQFLQWYGDRPILKVKKVDVLAYAKYLKEFKFSRKLAKGQKPKPPKNYSEMSQFQKKMGLKIFLQWIHTEHHIEDLSLVLKLKTPKREHEINKTLTYEDVDRLLKGCQHPRDQAMLHFLIDLV